MTTKPKGILVTGGYVSLLLASAAAMADDPAVPTQIVDLANKVDGVHPGFRAFHAKGVFSSVQDPFRLPRSSYRESYCLVL